MSLTIRAAAEQRITSIVLAVGRALAALAAHLRGRWHAAATAHARRRLVVDPELARQLLAEIDVPTFPGVAPNTTTLFDQRKCQHCQGLHSRKCPAIAEIEYHSDGTVKRVAYFPHGAWPADQVLWLEDVQEAAAFAGGEQR